MSDRLKMGLIGCGGMSGAHMRGYQELWSKGLKCFDIVAACDIDASRAEERATQAHEFQGGTKPAVYTDVAEMLVDRLPALKDGDSISCPFEPVRYRLRPKSYQDIQGRWQ